MPPEVRLSSETFPGPPGNSKQSFTCETDLKAPLLQQLQLTFDRMNVTLMRFPLTEGQNCLPVIFVRYGKGRYGKGLWTVFTKFGSRLKTTPIYIDGLSFKQTSITAVLNITPANKGMKAICKVITVRLSFSFPPLALLFHPWFLFSLNRHNMN